LLSPDNADLEGCIGLAKQAIDRRIRQSTLRNIGELQQMSEALQTLMSLRLQLEEGKRKAGWRKLKAQPKHRLRLRRKYETLPVMLAR
jgi:hypothetical protein